MEIESGGKTVATVKKPLVSPLRDRYSIEVKGGDDLEAKGNIVDHEFSIKPSGDQVAEVSKRWFRVRNTYGIEVGPRPVTPVIVSFIVYSFRLAFEFVRSAHPVRGGHLRPG